MLYAEITIFIVMFFAAKMTFHTTVVTIRVDILIEFYINYYSQILDNQFRNHQVESQIFLNVFWQILFYVKFTLKLFVKINKNHAVLITDNKNKVIEMLLYFKLTTILKDFVLDKVIFFIQIFFEITFLYESLKKICLETLQHSLLSCCDVCRCAYCNPFFLSLVKSP